MCCLNPLLVNDGAEKPTGPPMLVQVDERQMTLRL
jgi:hypothetical protein